MGKYAIILSMALYLFISYSNARERDYPHALIWFAYAISQAGFLWYEYTKD